MGDAGGERQASQLTIRILGPFEARIGGKPLPRLRTRRGEWLLALLALRAGQAVERGWLAGTLWPESDEGQALTNLRVSLKDLRHALGEAAGCLRAPSPRLLSLDACEVAVDATTFDAALARGDPASLEQAVSLYRGPLLEGCCEEWAFQERQAREQAYLAARERLAALALEEGETAKAERHLRLAVAVDPLHESTQRALMQVLAASGNYAAAVLAYRELRLLLHRELNVEPDPETQTLFQQLRREARRLAAKRTGGFASGPAAPQSLAICAGDADDGPVDPRLPGDVRSPAAPNGATRPVLPPLTRFIGRRQEIAEVKRLLSSTRLLTLTGAGGCGKTRLAFQVAADLAQDSEAPRRGGVGVVELASLADPGLVPQAVAAATGVRESPDRSLIDQLVAALQSRSLLIVLDNCEHLLAGAGGEPGCAPVVERLLQSCAELRILATSREPLNVGGETTYRLPSLAVPPEGEPLSPARLAQVEAVQLFLDRCQAAMPSFTLTEANAPAVAQICRRLDGIPLAIELAAARVRVLPVEQISERLDGSFYLLTAGSRTAPPRHQTLRALIDWSYQLLSREEQRLLGRLSVFVGGWTLEAAEAVCGEGRRGSGVGGRVDKDQPSRPPTPDILHPDAVLGLLASLIDKSLVGVEVEGSEARYRFLETIRQFAQERLAETGGEETLRERHAAYFLAQAELQEPDLAARCARLARELDNLRAALAWCQQDAAGGEAGLRIAGALGAFWDVRGHLKEGIQWLTGALAHPGAAARTAARAHALLPCGHHVGWHGAGPAAARPYLEECLSIAGELEDQPLRADALRLLGGLRLLEGDLPAARRWGEESLAVAREAANKRTTAAGLGLLGLLADAQGQSGEARRLLDEALALTRELGQWMYGWHFIARIKLAMEEEDDQLARSLAEEALASSRRVRFQSTTAPLLGKLALLATKEGNEAAAKAYWAESLTIWRDLGEAHPVPECLEGLAALAGSGGQPERAARLFGAAAALRVAQGKPPSPPESAWCQRSVASVRKQMGEAGFATVWAQGQAMSMEGAILFALDDGDAPPSEAE